MLERWYFPTPSPVRREALRAAEPCPQRKWARGSPLAHSSCFGRGSLPIWVIAAPLSSVAFTNSGTASRRARR